MVCVCVCVFLLWFSRRSRKRKLCYLLKGPLTWQSRPHKPSKVANLVNSKSNLCGVPQNLPWRNWPSCIQHARRKPENKCCQFDAVREFEFEVFVMIARLSVCQKRQRQRERERMREGWHTRRTLASALRISTSNHAIKKETTQCREGASCSGQKRTPCCKAKWERKKGSTTITNRLASNFFGHRPMKMVEGKQHGRSIERSLSKIFC